MIKTTYQTPEIRDSNDNIVQQGAFGKNTPLSNSTNDGWIDYVVNNLEALHDTIGDSAATLDGNGHVVEPANLAIGDEDGNRLKTNYLKLSGGTVSGTVNVAQNLKMQDNQENVFGGLYVPASSANQQYLQIYGGESVGSTGYGSTLYLFPYSDGHFTLRARNNGTNYDLRGNSDGTLTWRGNTLAQLASPAFTGNPTATTQDMNDTSTRLATTAFVRTNIINKLFQVGNADVTAIESGDDLDDYRTAGTYKSAGSTITNSLVNAPFTGAGFKMIVTTLRSSSDVMQIVFVHSGEMYIRGYQGSNTSWTTWRKIALSKDVLPLTGGTLSGQVTITGVNPASYPSGALRVQYTGITDGTSPSANRGGAVLRITDASGDSLGSIYRTIYANGRSTMGMYNSWNGVTKGFSIMIYGSVYHISPDDGDDNLISLGYSSQRWKQLYAGTTTISTSDERLKENITPIDDAVLDAWGEVGWVQYQFKESVEEKGETKARLHTGAIAQRIESVFASHGLDANRYGLLCYDEWDYTPAERDENGNIVEEAKPAGNRYSLRYEEALCMEAAYQRRRADRLEERIARLEALVINE